MVAVLSPLELQPKPQVVKPNRYRQLEIYQYILEARKPTLAELCAQLPEYHPPKIKRRYNRRSQSNKERKYPKNWAAIARQTKEEKNYVCQICNLQCLRPEDNKHDLTRSEIAKLTANVHHIDGNGMNNLANNLLVVCSTDHLLIHAGRRGNPHRGQKRLFDLALIE